MTCSTHEFGRDRATSTLKSSSISIGMCSSQCSPVLNMFSTNFPRVVCLLAVIQCNDAGFQAAMTSFHIDMSPLGNRNSFEATDKHILPYDPVVKKITSNKRGSSEISDTSKVEVYSFGTKAGIGNTGVHLRYQKTSEYATLSKY